ncbi:MAG: serine hydrolase, partial [Oscillospiraceae bacterium]
MPITKEAIARAEELKLRPDRLEHLEKMLNQWIAEEKRQAVVVKVNRFQTTVFEGAYGTNTKDMPVSCDTIFSVASITKSIIASLAMLLQEDGMLDLTDSVNKYIPEFDGEG